VAVSVEPVAADKARFVRAMFTRIAGRYDLMNRLMSGGRDRAWREAVAKATIAAPAGLVLDLATGTADVALAITRLAPYRRVVGADFSEGMLRQARQKVRRHPRVHVSLLAADALELPFADATFACVTSAFLLRNLADLERGLAEMRRVTRPGGRIVTLDIVRPTLPGFSTAFGVYFNRVVPAIGALVAGDRSAYTYLPDSVSRFVTPDELSLRMRAVGLKQPTYRKFALGTIAVHSALV
jgi:demethylmenaquinone methyltransferase/2-methoxy-6-polyprenyl-1,4-benzoquinol methylase